MNNSKNPWKWLFSAKLFFYVAFSIVTSIMCNVCYQYEIIVFICNAAFFLFILIFKLAKDKQHYKKLVNNGEIVSFQTWKQWKQDNMK